MRLKYSCSEAHIFIWQTNWGILLNYFNPAKKTRSTKYNEVNQKRIITNGRNESQSRYYCWYTYQRKERLF